MHFQFADTTYTYDQLHASIKSRWATKLDQIRTQDKKAIEKVKRQSHKINHPVWARISSFFKDLSIFRHLDSFISIENGLREGSVMRRMYSRTISKPTDEALVFSSMLHVSSGSAGKLLALEPADRIRAVFKTLDEVPLELIYFDTPRYEEDGCRWMPRSLLSQASATAQRMPNNTLDAWIETDTNRENVLGLSFKQHARVVSFPSRLGHVPSKVYWNGYAGRVHEAGSDRPLELPLTHDLILLMPVLDPFGSPFSTLSRFTAVLASIKKIPVEPKKFDDAEDAWPGSLNTFKHTWVVRHEGLVHFDAVSEAKGYTRMALVPLMSGASNAARYGFRLT